jgi:hypothetical protein
VIILALELPTRVQCKWWETNKTWVNQLLLLLQSRTTAWLYFPRI